MNRPETVKFTWFDVPRSIWYFLGPDKARWSSFNIVLFFVFFYDLVPPLIVGRMIDFFTEYRVGDSLRTFYIYAIFLGVAHTVVSLIRLTSKGKLSRIGIKTRARARVQGFESLINLPLHWHAHENTGNKIERVFTGSQALREWSYFTSNSLFPTSVAFIGVLTAFIFLSPIFFFFLIVYTILFFSIEYYFNRKIAALNDAFNKSNQAASGSYMESTSNLLSIKAMGSEKSLNSRVKKTEERSEEIQLTISDTGIYKWYSFQTLNGLSFTLFFLLIGHQVVTGLITVGSILVYYTYFNKLREAASDANDATVRA